MKGGRAAGWPPLGCPPLAGPQNPHLAPRGRAGLSLGGAPAGTRGRSWDLPWRDPAGGPGPRGAWEGGRERVLPQALRGKAPPWRGAGVWKGVRVGGSAGRSPPGGAAFGWGSLGEPRWGGVQMCGPGPGPGRNSGRNGLWSCVEGPSSERGPRAPLHRNQTSKGRDLHGSGPPLPQSPCRKPHCPVAETRSFNRRLLSLPVSLGTAGSEYSILEARCMKIRAIGLPSPGCWHQFSSGTRDPGLCSGRSREAKPLQSSVFALHLRMQINPPSLVSWERSPTRSEDTSEENRLSQPRLENRLSQPLSPCQVSRGGLSALRSQLVSLSTAQDTRPGKVLSPRSLPGALSSAVTV